VRVARLAGWPLVISAKIREPAERAYFDQQVRPLLGPGGDMPVEQPLAVRLELMRYAAALVNPIAWPEPFGLVMAEALAAATPVLAFPNGATPGIVEHGQTGYLCRSEEEMAAAVARVRQISRWRCRAAAERRFPWPRWPPATNGDTGPSWNARPSRRRGDGNRPPRRDPGYQGIAMRSHLCGPVLMMVGTRGLAVVSAGGPAPDMADATWALTARLGRSGAMAPGTAGPTHGLDLGGNADRHGRRGRFPRRPSGGRHQGGHGG